MQQDDVQDVLLRHEQQQVHDRDNREETFCCNVKFNK